LEKTSPIKVKELMPTYATKSVEMGHAILVYISQKKKKKKRHKKWRIKEKDNQNDLEQNISKNRVFRTSLSD